MAFQQKKAKLVTAQVMTMHAEQLDELENKLNEQLSEMASVFIVDVRIAAVNEGWFAYIIYKESEVQE